MDFQNITAQYYSKWLGKDDVLLDGNTGIEWIYSSERNRVQHGYSSQFDLYILIRPEKIVISYGDKVCAQIEEIKRLFAEEFSVEGLKDALSNLLQREVGHSIKYCFERIPGGGLAARVLRVEDYPLYLQFFMASHPGCEDTEWLKEYFEEMVQNGICCGAFWDDQLVSCTDAPGMPYMEAVVQEIGISTRQDFRNRGFAAAACVSAVKAIIDSGKCPIWSTSASNITSQKLAEKVGFVKFADVLTVTL